MSWAQVLKTIESEFVDLSDVEQLTRACTRLTVAILLGAAIGWERERRRSAAGLRTHMLVALGAALFVLAPAQAGLEEDGLSRVLQGVISGIGFLGAGAVLKLSEQGEIRGLTTAASIWATAAIGVAVGQGREATALLATLIVLAILVVLAQLERRMHHFKSPGTQPEDDDTPRRRRRAGDAADES
ncbi:MgtC/SapB family protein [Azohydromonas caseinilytica]|uniref:Protein MgtC n=1 Tax=Azohydromonas caseinilytica TaxID=2728836 RepID=A0A848FGW3_9BURK|nr:MgtC/SapB family protein [Azohydromonas caseinilytica]NML17539.1 MgtC/SapB family protein [Azohydromonas caseinilytica]